MGYLTAYKLKIKKFSQEVKHFTDIEEHEFQEILGMFIKKYDLSDVFDEDGETNNQCKWYSHEKDLIAFSNKYPQYLFELSGKGDEPFDLWKLFVKNRRSHRDVAQIIIQYNYNPIDLL